jgi:hypothetical protein
MGDPLPMTFDGESERIQFLHDYPIPTRDHAALLASYRLLLDEVEDSLPVSVASRGETTFFEDWEITRAAFMARMAGTARHMSYLAPSYSRLDAFALARTLVDHVITFAWISAAPKERLPVFLRDSFENLGRKDERSRSRGEGGLLGDGERVDLSASVGQAEQRMPKLRQRSVDATAEWRERVSSALPEELHIVDFERMYHDVYDHYATYDHPTTTGLQVFVHLSGDPAVATVDGDPEHDRETDLRPYWIAVFAFAQALVVSSSASGRPRPRSLKRALATIGTMRELERAGRLLVSVSDDGAVNIGVADDDTGTPSVP